MLATVEATVLQPVLPAIAAEFPDKGGVQITMLATSVFITMMLFSLIITPLLARRFDKRPLILIAIAIYTIAGLLMLWFSTTYEAILISRLLQGACMGIATPLGVAVINNAYDGLTRMSMFGWANAFGAAVSIASGTIAGILAANNWRYIFLMYTIFIVVLLIQFMFLPHVPPETFGKDKEKIKIHYTGKQVIKLVMVSGYVYAFMLCTIVVSIKSTFVIEERQLGNVALLAGIFLSVSGIFNVLSGVVYGFLARGLKKFLPAFTAGCIAFSALLLFFANSITLLYIAAAINGFGAGVSAPMQNDKITAVGPPQNATFSAGIVNFLVGAGIFSGTFMELIYEKFVENTAVNMMLCSAVAFGIITLFSVVYAIVNPLKGINYQEQLDAGLIKPEPDVAGGDSGAPSGLG
jgi:MFS family permease